MIAKIINRDGQFSLISKTKGIENISIEDVKKFLLDPKSFNIYDGDNTWDYDISLEEYFMTETIVAINDSYNLEIIDLDLLQEVFIKHPAVNYLTVKEYAAKHGLADRTVRQYCQKGKFKNYIEKDNGYLIWEDEPLPDK